MITQRRVLGFFLAASILALGGALISQVGFGLKPCHLCLYQRIPYTILIAFLTPLLFYKNIPLIRARVIMALVGIILLSGSAIAAYHTGVEYKWWQGPTDCAGGDTPDSMDDLRQQIMDAPAVRCDEPAFIFLGLSMAGWNALYSLGLSVLAFGWSITCRRAKN